MLIQVEPEKKENNMRTLHNFLATEVTIRGQDLDALTGLDSNIAKPGIEKAVKFRARVRYPDRRYVDSYEFPAIKHGDAQPAWVALEQLWRQRALTSEQHDLLGNAIRIAEAFSE
jgi:hypothetical protein